MVLEPVSAFALACNILQVIDTGTKFVRKAVEYRNAVDGQTEERKTLRNIADTLKNLGAEVENASSNSSEGVELNSAEAKLLDANRECVRLSNEFILLLDKLKVKDNSSGWEIIGKTFKSMRYKDKLDDIKEAVIQARGNLTIAFLVIIQQDSYKLEKNVLESNKDGVTKVLQTINSSSEDTQAELKRLSERLDHSPLESADAELDLFCKSHPEMLRALSAQLDKAVVNRQASTLAAEGLILDKNVALAQQRILQILHFPGIYARRDQVEVAYKGTFDWILTPNSQRQQRWDNFRVWAESKVEPHRRLYWVHGKPGSGKSTLMRFLDQNIHSGKHLQPWAENTPVVSASYFFWNPGTRLQKSITGALRSLLSQLLRDTPSYISTVVPRHRWDIACANSYTDPFEWSEDEMKYAIQSFVSESSTKVLFLIDGLDELEGTDEKREELIGFLQNLAAFENVKLCISSRPWNIFSDAFADCPQLKMEDLTLTDITQYVRGELSKNKRFQRLQDTKHAKTVDLVGSIVDKANGVFLWVRLVVRDLLRALRDGDSLHKLLKILDDIPVDLDVYFSRIMDSVDEKHRQEAALIFQVLLYQEERFDFVIKLRLLDISFVDECRADFALLSDYDYGDFSLSEVWFRLDSAIRKVNSRCMGLVECHDTRKPPKTESSMSVVPEYAPLTSQDPMDEASVTSKPDDFESKKLLAETAGYEAAFDFEVFFFHRSVRDFLLSESSQRRIQKDARGTFNVVLFLCNTRLVQLKALSSAETSGALRGDLFRDVINMISLANMGKSHMSVLVAEQLELAWTAIADKRYLWDSMFEILDIRFLPTEGSNFLTLAIDFNLHAYVMANLRPEALQQKRGRPVVDNIVYGPFNTRANFSEIGNQFPNVEILKQVLVMGADPNQEWDGMSAWARFLRAMMMHACLVDPKECVPKDKASRIESADVAAFGLMLQYGAQIHLPFSWVRLICDMSDGLERMRSRRDHRRVFTSFRQVQASVPLSQRSREDRQRYAAVVDILKAFREAPHCEWFAKAFDQCIQLLPSERSSARSLVEVE